MSPEPQLRGASRTQAHNRDRSRSRTLHLTASSTTGSAAEPETAPNTTNPWIPLSTPTSHTEGKPRVDTKKAIPPSTDTGTHARQPQENKLQRTLFILLLVFYTLHCTSRAASPRKNYPTCQPFTPPPPSATDPSHLPDLLHPSSSTTDPQHPSERIQPPSSTTDLIQPPEPPEPPKRLQRRKKTTPTGRSGHEPQQEEAGRSRSHQRHTTTAHIATSDNHNESATAPNAHRYSTTLNYGPLSCLNKHRLQYESLQPNTHTKLTQHPPTQELPQELPQKALPHKPLTQKAHSPLADRTSPPCIRRLHLATPHSPMADRTSPPRIRRLHLATPHSPTIEQAGELSTSLPLHTPHTTSHTQLLHTNQHTQPPHTNSHPQPPQHTQSLNHTKPAHTVVSNAQNKLHPPLQIPTPKYTLIHNAEKNHPQPPQ